MIVSIRVKRSYKVFFVQLVFLSHIISYRLIYVFRRVAIVGSFFRLKLIQELIVLVVPFLFIGTHILVTLEKLFPICVLIMQCQIKSHTGQIYFADIIKFNFERVQIKSAVHCQLVMYQRVSPALFVC